MINQYTKITEYYDLWVSSGYYDYQSLASEAHSIVGNGRELLELGVNGTTGRKVPGFNFQATSNEEMLISGNR